MAPLKTFFFNVPPALTFAAMPFLIISQTAGTPIIIVGLSARMSPTQLRTDASVSVFTRA